MRLKKLEGQIKPNAMRNRVFVLPGSSGEHPYRTATTLPLMTGYR